MSAPVRLRPPGRVTVLAYALALLSIGITEDWRLLHEDNGAFHTTLALSHVRLGLARTRAHDLFYNPHSGAATPYGHHPPGTALLLAGAFQLTGSQAPWAARLVPIAFQLGSLALLMELLARFFPPRGVLLGGLLAATVPMSAYFGRMVNYEPLCLFAVLLQLLGWVDASTGTGRRRGLLLLAIGVVLGGLIDWPAFFFAGAIGIAELLDLLRAERAARTRRFPLLVVVVAGAATLTVLLDLAHLAYAGQGSLARLGDVVGGSVHPGSSRPGPLAFVLNQLENGRRYFTHSGLAASLVVGASLLARQSRVARAVLSPDRPAILARLLAVSGSAALAYVLSAPSWAMAHAYWQFYFLPFVVLSTLLVGRVVPRVILAVMVLEIAVTSGWTLHYRYTHPKSYAIRQTAILRETFLAPDR